jgi:hypothetical protein
MYGIYKVTSLFFTLVKKSIIIFQSSLTIIIPGPYSENS